MSEMNTPTADEITRVRAIADQVGQKMGDASFKAQYDADPHAALIAQGMPSAAAREYLNRSGQTEVAGYATDDYGNSSYFSDYGFHDSSSTTY